MRLLIVTQKVDKNDPILGFFHRWIEEFAKHCDKVTVVCLGKGEYDLPINVKVLSLGKEEGKSKIPYLLQFYKYIWNERKNYDSVFVHMNPEYIVFGGMLWRLGNKRVGMWYVHRQTNLKLWLAEMWANVVFTSAPESFRLKSKKVLYVGHGVDSDRFSYAEHSYGEPLSLLHVGRITPIKNIETIIHSVKNLMNAGISVRNLSLVGEPVTKADEEYKQSLVSLSKQLEIEKYIVWKGSVKNELLPQVYADHTLSINSAPPGGMDKTVLESWACGVPAFFSNSAFRSIHSDLAAIFSYMQGDSRELAGKVVSFLKHPNKEELANKLSQLVHQKYGIESVVNKIVAEMK